MVNHEPEAQTQTASASAPNDTLESTIVQEKTTLPAVPVEGKEPAEEQPAASVSTLEKASPATTAMASATVSIPTPAPAATPAPQPPAHQQLQSLLFQQSQSQRMYHALVQQNDRAKSIDSSSTPPIQGQASPPQTSTSLHPSPSSSSAPGPSRCFFCGTSATPLWRRDQSGKAVCNACGLANIRKQNAVRMYQNQQQSGQNGLGPAYSPPSQHSPSLPPQYPSQGHDSASNTSLRSNSSPPSALISDRALTPVTLNSNPEIRGSPAPVNHAMRINGLLNAATPRLSGSPQPALNTLPAISPARQAVPLPKLASPADKPAGSCPGDGYCNGEGGKACCSGCPAFNNRYRANSINRMQAAPAEVIDVDAVDVKPAQQALAEIRAHQQAIGLHHELTRPNDHLPSSSRKSTPASAATPAPPSQPHQQEDSEIGAMQCENCGTRTTPLWRRDGEGRFACNACGLYYKLHGVHRPVNLNKPTIKRRKRVPAANAASSAAIQKAHNVNATTSASAGPAADPTINEPARKKQRKAPGSISSESHRSGSLPPSSPASTHATLPSTRPNNLTGPELAAVAALAMHANHQSSFSHSAQLDSETLNSHAHPLHSLSAVEQAARKKSASRLEANSVGTAAEGRDALAHPLSLDGLSGEDGLRVLRDNLKRECAQARETIARLEAFLSKSDSMLAALDSKLNPPKDAPPAQPAPLPSISEPIVDTTTDADTSMEAPPQPDLLKNLLDSIPVSSAQPSALLKRRKIDAKASSPSSKSIQLQQSKSLFKVVWEICPANAGVTVVSTTQR